MGILIDKKWYNWPMVMWWKKKKLKKYLDTDLKFYVNGRGACFLSSILCRWLWLWGRQFDTIDEAMEAKVFDGKSLVDIWDEIFPQVS